MAQTLRYAEELQHLHGQERRQRRAAEEALERVEESYRATVRALAAALHLRDDRTGDHADRVTALGLLLTAEVAPRLAENPQLEYGFLLHDIGKIGIPDSILLKPGRLTRSERDEMQDHPWLGERIVAQIPYLNNIVREVVASHHEHWDGGGYPRRLAGTGIPLGARIFSVVDAYDAMTMDRPYRAALPRDAAIGEIAYGAGTQFDPAIAEAFAALEPGFVAHESQPASESVDSVNLTTIR
jgi:HD-GYP domain-containing protein (c-di-GMP phosphodiesterase class II)